MFSELHFVVNDIFKKKYNSKYLIEVIDEPEAEYLRIKYKYDGKNYILQVIREEWLF